jgi:organic hydroperoxide reductase OsmC/OhrA
MSTGRTHRYRVDIEWLGNRGSGTTGYRDYGREHRIEAVGKPEIPGSSDPAFLGDPARWNPEDLLVASLAACHKLWYLHLASSAGVVVTAYHDRAEGVMEETAEGDGRFAQVTLHPWVTIAAGSDASLALDLHEAAHEKCFIANSVNFPVACRPTIISEGA